MKRKENSETKSRKRKNPGKNPFLELQAASFPATTNNDVHDEVLSRVLAFSEASNQRSKDNEESKELVETVMILLQYLERQEAVNSQSAGDPFMSPTDVATMLLQWAVKKLVHASNHLKSSSSVSDHSLSIYWKTLRSCLSVLSSRMNDVSANISNCLSQSTLNKLVPFSAQTALSENEGSDAVACFSLLVDHMYCPTIDSACHSLLPLVDKLISNMSSIEDCRLVLSVQGHYQVLMSTVNLLKRLKKLSNPKKVFQLLSEPKVLSALSRWRLSGSGNDSINDNATIDANIQELLFEGLFSPLHHFDGFRGLVLAVPTIAESDDTQTASTTEEKPKSYHCYQETLLDTVSRLIRDSDDNESTKPVALLVPELLKGLISMFARWERDSAAKLKKKGGRDLTIVQFRLWCNLVYPMVLELNKDATHDEKRIRLASNPTLVLLRSLRETLVLVTENNLYIPSNKDDNHVCFRFLEGLTSKFLDMLHAVIDLEASDLISQVMSECHGGLESLLRLNHLVAHKRLHLLLSVCGRVPSSSNQQESSVVNFSQRSLVLVIIQTYHRLRQLDHLFLSLLKATDTTHGLVSKDLKELLLENRVRQEFVAAVAKCPPSQVKDLFEILNVWIPRRANEGPSSKSASDVSFAVSLFILLTQNVRVDKHTSTGIVALCDDSIKKAVLPLIQSSDQSLKREGLILSGWLVDLTNRCAFWYALSDEDKTNEELNIVPTILKESSLASVLVDEEGMADYTNEIQFLLLHRIRELHTSIYEEQCSDLRVPGKRFEESPLVMEARRCVDVVIRVSSSDNAATKPSSVVLPGTASGWKLISETVLHWVPYSEPKHVEAFLSWMFTALSVPRNSIPAESEATMIKSERAVAEALLCDASFFEIPEIAAQFHCVGLKCVFGLLKAALSKEKEKAKFGGEILSFQGLELTSTSCQYTVEQLGGAMNAISPTTVTKPFQDISIKPEQLEQTMRIIRLLNGVPLPPTGVKYALVIQLDVLLCTLCLKFSVSTSEFAILPFICASRKYMGAVMGCQPDGINSRGFVSLVGAFVRSTTEVMKLLSSLDEKKQLLKVSESVIESIATASFSVYQTDAEPLMSLIECFGDLLADDSHRDVDESRVMINVTRALVKRVTALCRRSLLLEDSMSLRSIVSPFITSIREAFLTSDKFPASNESMQAEWLLLTGDVERLSSLVESKPSETIDASLIEKSLETSDDAVVRAAEYSLACFVASGHISPPLSKILVNKCLSGSTQLLDATFCGLVRGMDAENTRRLLECLLNEARESTDRKLHALHLFHLVIEHVEGELPRIEVSQFARAFFALCVDIMRPFHVGADLSTWESECDLGISLLIALTENKDIVSIRERDLALILVQVASVLGVVRKPAVAQVDGRVHSACFALVSSLLQRFPKQLYACAPTVISTIHVLLRHALYNELSDQESGRRAQMVTRLCELLVPHRDVYKKHVLPLILEYVGAMRSGIHPSKSKGIVPAVYCLLDMLSKFETEQLNTMMDNTSKALFRSVYQSHQKTHMYKGQY